MALSASGDGEEVLQELMCLDQPFEDAVRWIVIEFREVNVERITTQIPPWSCTDNTRKAYKDEADRIATSYNNVKW